MSEEIVIAEADQIWECTNGLCDIEGLKIKSNNLGIIAQVILGGKAAKCLVSWVDVLQHAPAAALFVELQRRNAITFDYPHVKQEGPAGEAEQDDEFNDYGDPVGGCYECRYVVTTPSENGPVYRCGLRDSRPIVDPIEGDCVGWDPIDGWQHIPRPVVPATPVNRFETGELVCGWALGNINGYELEPKFVNSPYDYTFGYGDVDPVQKVTRIDEYWAKPQGGEKILITKEEVKSIEAWIKETQEK
jgi:hypothetical protein